MINNDELQVITALRRDIQRQHDLIADLNRQLDAEKNENRTIRWMVRGIAADRAHFTVTLQAHMESKELLRAAEVFGGNAAHELLRLGKLAFKDHARMYMMRSYITTLQNRLRAEGMQFRDLGEDNSGPHHIFDEKWESPDYYGTEIIKSIVTQL